MTSAQLCYFTETGTLHHRVCQLDKTEFIAISHIWGEADWHTLPGIEQPVLVSPHKARWIENELWDLVGSNFFWMDVLAVDQSDKNERVKIVQKIPSIYRSAVKTIVVRESGGIGACCKPFLDCRFGIELLGEDLEDTSKDAIGEHIMECHRDAFAERWMSRLWPLQELLLSDVVHFVVCEGGPIIPAPRNSIDTISDCMNVWYDICGLGTAWMWYGKTNRAAEMPSLTQKAMAPPQVFNFLKALVENSSVARETFDQLGVEKGHHITDDLRYLLYICRNSQRKTGRAQDFILAFFPAFPWYQTPFQVSVMSFEELFDNACMQMSQGCMVNLLAHPKFLNGVSHYRSIYENQSRQSTPNIPLPKTLADFCGLFHIDHYDLAAKHSKSLSAMSMADLQHGDVEVVLERLSHYFIRFPLSRLSQFMEKHKIFMKDWESQYSSLLQKKLLLAAEEDASAFLDTGHIVCTYFNAFEHYSRYMTESMLLPWDWNAEKIFRLLLVMHIKCRYVHDAKHNLGFKNDIIQYESGVISFRPAWQSLRVQARKYDCSSFRSSLFLLTAVIGNDLGLSSYKWCQDHVRPFLVHASLYAPTWLCLGPKDLELDDISRIQIDNTTGIGPAVTGFSRSELKLSRVEDLAVLGKKPAFMSHFRLTTARVIGFTSLISRHIDTNRMTHYRGCLYVNISDIEDSVWIEQLSPIIRQEEVVFGYAPLDFNRGSPTLFIILKVFNSCCLRIRRLYYWIRRLIASVFHLRRYYGPWTFFDNLVPPASEVQMRLVAMTSMQGIAFSMSLGAKRIEQDRMEEEQAGKSADEQTTAPDPESSALTHEEVFNKNFNSFAPKLSKIITECHGVFAFGVDNLRPLRASLQMRGAAPLLVHMEDLRRVF